MRYRDSRSSLKRWLRLCFLASLAARVMEIELRSATAGNEEVVRLDQIVVEASAGTPWKYVALPGYEILSRCADSTTTQYLEALQREQAAREALLPAAYWGQTGAPFTVIWYQEEPAAAATGFVARRPIDVDWAEAGTAFATKNLVQAGAPMTGDGDLFITAVNLGNLRGPIKDLTVDPDSELRLKLHAPAYPSWFLEELLGLYRRHFVELGSGGKAVLVLPAAIWISPENTASLTKAFRASRKKKRPLPIPDLIPLKDLLTVAPAPEDKARWESG